MPLTYLNSLQSLDPKSRWPYPYHLPSGLQKQKIVKRARVQAPSECQGIAYNNKYSWELQRRLSVNREPRFFYYSFGQVSQYREHLYLNEGYFRTSLPPSVTRRYSL